MNKKRKERKNTKPSIEWWDQQFCGSLQHQRLSSHPNKKRKRSSKKKERIPPQPPPNPSKINKINKINTKRLIKKGRLHTPQLIQLKRNVPQNPNNKYTQTKKSKKIKKEKKNEKTLFWILTLAQCSTKIFTTSSKPILAATWRGVHPALRKKIWKKKEFLKNKTQNKN